MKLLKYVLPAAILLLVGFLIVRGLKPETAPPQAGIRHDRSPAASSSSEISTTEDAQTPRRKDTREAREQQKEVDRLTEEAMKLFQSGDYAGAIALLDKANAISGPNADVLNLRGSCYVQLREMDKALADFEVSASLAKGNPTIRFNVGEMHFVTKRWQESIDVFEKMNRDLPEMSTSVSRLVEFKILLCKNKLGRTDEVRELAAKYNDKDSSPFHWYAAALIAGENGDEEKARELIAAASQKFSDPAELAPWQDTMIEYRSQ